MKSWKVGSGSGSFEEDMLKGRRRKSELEQSWGFIRFDLYFSFHEINQK